MKKNKYIQEELEELSPLLSKMKREGTMNSFQVPADFFSNLPDLVLEQTTEKQALISQTKSRNTWWKMLQNYINPLFEPRYAVGFATLALLVIAVFYLNSDGAMKTDMIALEDLSSEEIGGYISQNLDEFQEELLEEEEMAVWFKAEESLNIEDGELEKYLEDVLEDLDVQTLENFL